MSSRQAAWRLISLTLLPGLLVPPALNGVAPLVALPASHQRVFVREAMIPALQNWRLPLNSSTEEHRLASNEARPADPPGRFNRRRLFEWVGRAGVALGTSLVAPAVFAQSRTHPLPSSLLQSQFFRDDPLALSIAAGVATTEIDVFDYIVGVKPGDTATFAYKVISGLRQLGYTFPYSLTAGERPARIILNHFQQLNGLPVTMAITRDLILRLDELLSIREDHERRLPKFPLLDKFTDAPLNEPPNRHLGALLTLAFTALPEIYRPWTTANFYQAIWQVLGTYISLPDGDYRIEPGYHPQSAVLGSLAWIWTDDYTFVSTMLHEYAHYLDGGIYWQVPGAAQGTIVNTREFYDISYDVSTEFRNPASGWLHYKLRPGNDTDFISSYSKGWYVVNNGQTLYTAYEDFAECFGAYVLHGIEFRDLAKTNPVLARKYQWLKTNVFQGKDFETGNPRYLTYFPDGTRPLNVIDYQRADPAFVWDYTILQDVPFAPPRRAEHNPGPRYPQGLFRAG